MRYMSTAEIREKYLAFFESKGCKRMPSSSLIPDDPSLLLTSAGMVQFKPYFLQQKHLEDPYIGTTTVQKCVRTNDIDIIGKTGRHLSFFEMLGNFSFGAYFKKEMCAWAYEFSTKVLELPHDQLYFTVFEDDDETIEIWKELGVHESHISRLGEDDNFWRAGPTGPCGPCSEIYFDQGPEVGCKDPACAPGCDCDRFLEFWNCVFTQYDGQEDGSLVPLPKKNIDTGMGLERMAAIMQGVTNNYDTDVLRDLIAVGEKLSNTRYGTDDTIDLALRIMADHSRSVTFMIADGILPSNEGRGYVLRRLLRRAVMKAHLIGIKGSFLHHYVAKIIELMGHVYPEIVENRNLVERVILSEEERFGSTLHQGQAYLLSALEELEGNVLPGDVAFTLHDTYGFPFEVTEEICLESNIALDKESFKTLMEDQKNRARAHVKDADKAWSTFDGLMSSILERCGKSEFLGYERHSSEAQVLALVVDGKEVSSVTAPAKLRMIVDKTPAYAEKGGQIGDMGSVTSSSAQAALLDVQEPEAGLIVHDIDLSEGSISLGDTVTIQIDSLRRARIARNHTATHILHWALRKVLGDHVKQAGSLVAQDRLRFDFTHFEALSTQQIRKIEAEANKVIMASRDVSAHITSLDEARAAGVIALFGEKYGKEVRVLTIDETSQELCGGTHVNNTAEIGFVKITSESGVGANLRRIEAVTSFDALDYVNKIQAELQETAGILHVPLFDVSERTALNLANIKEMNQAIKAAKQEASTNSLEKLISKTQDVGYPLLICRIDGSDAGDLRNAWDVLRSRMDKPGAVVLASNNAGVPILLAAGSPEAQEAGFNAKEIIKAISSHIKGGGGGNAGMAQAGGKDVAGLDAALNQAQEILVP